MANVIRVAEVVGWTFDNANTLATPEGSISLRYVSPAAVERRFKVDYQAKLDVDATKAILGEDLGSDQYGRQRILHFAGLRKERERLVRKGDHANAKLLLRVATGTVWTPRRIRKVFDDSSETCPMCGCRAEQADIQHYIQDCPAVNLQRQEVFYGPDSSIDHNYHGQSSTQRSPRTPGRHSGTTQGA